MRSATLLLSLVAALLPRLQAQCPPGASMPLDLSIETGAPTAGPAHTRWQAGKDALVAGDHATARGHLQAALEFHPSSAPILFDLMLASRDDADLLALHVDRFARAAANAQGRFTIDSAQKKAIGAVPGLDALLEPTKALLQQRAAAVAELARFVDRNKPSGARNAARAILVRWAAEAILVAGHGSPGMLTAVAAGVDKTQRAFLADHDLVLQALARIVRQKPSTADPAAAATPGANQQLERTVRAARILTGLAHQAKFKDLKGPPPPDVEALGDEAQGVLDGLEASRRKGKVWTIAELEQMSPEAANAFTLAHASWRAPGVASSPTGRYRIETTCGHTTLLDAARTIEQHHARLAAHFGSDPFAQRPGTVRIVPEHADLESDGSPYWWAGGFQAGDVTTLRFAWSDIASLGRGLTHELTHRFDGVLRPFLGAWYGEGHAEWTAGHYEKIADTAMLDDWLDVYVVANAYYKGYGGGEKFGKLLAGTIDDYRDNYGAGYSLYAFLRSYPPGAPRYREALATFERTARAGQKDPVGFFTRTFCDGKQGRPATLEEFIADWNTFLRGCYEWNDDKQEGNEWVGKYRRERAVDPRRPILDPPTRSWARERAEPWFGQDHAAAATLLLSEVGDVEATIAAGTWSLCVDGWRLETSRVLLAALGASKNGDAAAAFAALARRRFPSLEAKLTPLAGCPKPVLALIDAFAARSTALDAAGAHRAAEALAAARDDLALLCGVTPPPAPDAATPAAPPPPHHLGDHGFTESDLTDDQELRHKGLWYATEEGDLHVGRERPREGTGTLDREAHARHAFVHTVAWQRPGEYVLRGRVHFTTSFVSGCIVFGHVRADRDLRLHFSTGDYRYAIGKSERREEAGRLELDLRGLWERDGKLPETHLPRSLDIGDRQWFDYAIHVNGARVLVEIDGEAAIRYAMHDGAPIEGCVGFAMDTGAIRVQQPTVQRKDRGAPAAGVGIDLARPTAGSLEDVLLLPVRGVPSARDGTFVMWLPRVDANDASLAMNLLRVAPILAATRAVAHEHPQAWVIAVPRGLPAAERAQAVEAVGKDTPLVEHADGTLFVGNQPWVLFVDGQGILRAASSLDSAQFETKVKRWSRLFRGR